MAWAPGEHDVRVLDRQPALAALYARAVLRRPRRRAADQLSSTVLSLVDQRTDRDRLYRYQQVCGFRVSDVLPATFGHLLGFNLSIELMTQPDFPFPLLGLIHVENSITQVRPVDAAEVTSVKVWAAGLRDHPAGRQVDLNTEVAVDGEPVWYERSTYLRRGERPAESPAQSPAERPHGRDSGRAAEAQTRRGGPDQAESVSALVVVPPDIGRRYAAVSGDRNPIHLHNLTAKAFGFRRAIGHGMWLAGRSLAYFEGRLPDAFTFDARFKTPVFLPTKLVLDAATTETGWAVQVGSATSGRPHLTGSISKR
jgi:acyl dehydratase